MTQPVAEGELRDWIREYTPHLLAVARAFAADDVEAEDLLQEVWWRASRSASERTPGIPLRAWLVAVTINLGRDQWRRRRRRERLLALWSGVAEVTPPAPEPMHEGAPLWRAVADLPRLQRDVLVLRVIEGYSTVECARLLSRAEGTVKASLARALAKLRTKFDQEARWIPDTSRTITN